ncbi:MAG: alpha/beta hydrolase [Chloroflexota bacterium]
MSWTSNYVQANGIRLHYHRTGGGAGDDKRTMVLLHGVTDNGLCWGRLATAVSDQYDLILVDARGHGLSDAPEAGYSGRNHAADVIGLCHALQLEKPILLGHSMGAMTVANAIAMEPGLAGCAILEDPAWLSEAGAAATGGDHTEWRNNIIAAKSTPRETLIMRGKADNPTWDESEWAAWAEAKQQVQPQVLDGFTPDRYTAWKRLVPQFRCPTLLITADLDKGAIVSQETGTAASALNPHLTTAHIPNAGHSIRREQLDLYLAAINDFLAQS